MFALYRDPTITNNQQKKKMEVREGADVAQSDSQYRASKQHQRTSLVVQWLRLRPSVHWSPDRELRFHTPHGPENQEIKQKQYCNKVNKNLKEKGSHLKKKKKKEIFKKKSSIDLAPGLTF